VAAVILAAIGAFSFGLNNVVVRRAVTRVLDATVGVLITVPLSAVVFLLILVAMGQVGRIASFSWQSYGWFSAAGIFQFAVARALNYKLMQFVGINMGEPLSWQLVVGVLLIVSGITVTGLNPEMFRKGQGLFSGIPRKAYLLGLGVGLSRGITPLMIKLGLEGSGLPSPVAGVFISYAAATLVLSPFLWNSNKRAALTGMKRSALGFFSLTVLFSATAQLMRYFALSVGRVSVVAPVFATSAIFVLFFSYVFERKFETFGVNVVLGTVAVVIGSILLV
jgi:drug/metabolite transporter (DMT)-like permease